MLYRLDGRRPAKKVERRQSLDNVRTQLGRSRGSNRPSIGRWQKIVEPLETVRSVSPRSAAVACSGNPSTFARPREEIGLPVVGSAGTMYSIIKRNSSGVPTLSVCN
jgi:hypothetical protein